MAKFEGGEKNNKVVNRKEIDYSLMWPIALAPVIPAVGIALRCVRVSPRNFSKFACQLCFCVKSLFALFQRETHPQLSYWYPPPPRLFSTNRPYPKYRWPVIGTISGLVLLGAHNAVIGTGVNSK